MTVNHLLVSAADDKPVAGIKKNTLALWRGTNGADFAAAKTPKTKLNSLRFHSDLDYLRVKKVVKSTDAGRAAVNVPARGEGTILNVNSTLFAHDMGFTPLFIADITISGYGYTCNGTSMILPGGGSPQPRWFGFMADDTNIYGRAVGWLGSACTVHWRVHVLDEEFQTTKGFGDLFSFDPSGATLPRLGKIDTDHRFVRNVASGEDFRFAGNQTLKFGEEGGWATINFSDGVTNVAAATVNTTPWPSGSGFTVESRKCKV